MAKAIWKFPLRALDSQKVEMPEGARIIAAAAQHEQICLWAEVNEEAPKAARHFAVFGTGHAMFNLPMTHLGTVLLHGGALVLHVYEINA